MAWRRLGDKPLSEPMMVRLQTHICVTWPQLVKWNENVEKLYVYDSTKCDAFLILTQNSQFCKIIKKLNFPIFSIMEPTSRDPTKYSMEPNMSQLFHALYCCLIEICHAKLMSICIFKNTNSICGCGICVGRHIFRKAHPLWIYDDIKDILSSQAFTIFYWNQHLVWWKRASLWSWSVTSSSWKAFMSIIWLYGNMR